MTVKVPVGVRVYQATSAPRTGDLEQHLGAQLLSGLRFGASDPGGFATCEFTVSRSLARRVAELAEYGAVQVYDKRTGAILWDGRLEVPGREQGRGSGRYAVAAIGGQAHLKDRTLPVVYADQRLTSWAQREKHAFAASEFEITDTAAGSTGLPANRVLTRFPRGMPLATNTRATAGYTLTGIIGQPIARLDVGATGGREHASLRAQVVSRGLGVAGASADALQTDLGLLTTEQFPGIANMPGVVYGLDMRLLWNGAAATVGDDVTHLLWRAPRVQGRRYNALGTLLTTGYTVTVPALAVVNDVLGRFLPEMDRGGASVSASTEPLLAHLCYENGATAEAILDDLLLLMPGHTWQVWGRNSLGKYAFRFAPLPTTTTLEATTADGFTSPGSGADLYNEVDVRWKDEGGLVRHTIRTATSPALSTAGLTRRAAIDLGSEVGGTEAAAQAAGDAFLEGHLAPRNNGTLTVRRPIVDLESGRRLQPWELPRYATGRLIRVKNVQPRADALNRSGADATTIFRVAAATYDAGTNTGVLTLDGYDSSVAKVLARLERRLGRTYRE